MAKKTKFTNKSKSVPYIEEKIARICWNGKKQKGSDWLYKDWTTNGWERPSGASGKSEDKNSFENKFGYGFEEWLLDTTTKIGKHHYAFLQQFNRKSNKHVGKIYNIHLFAIAPYRHNGRKVMIYVGRIDNVEVINSIEQKKTYTYYNDKNRKWIGRMRNEVLAHPKTKIPNNPRLQPKDWFNIKFEPKDVVFYKYAPILDPGCIKNYRYVLMDYKPLIFINDAKNGKPITNYDGAKYDSKEDTMSKSKIKDKNENIKVQVVRIR